MFGKPKTAEEILKLIEALEETEQDKLFDALVKEDEEEKEEEKVETTEEVEETEEPAEEPKAEETEATEETAETETEEKAEETPEVEEETEGETETLPEQENPVDVLNARIETLEQTVKALADRLEAKEDEKPDFGLEGHGDAEAHGDGKSKSELAKEKYFAF